MKQLDRLMMVLAVLCGVGSLVAFVIIWPAGLINLRWPMWAALACDTLLSVVFFVQHSGMVRRSFRTWLARFVPARYDGAIYAIGSGLALAVVTAFWQPTEVHVFVVSGAGAWIVRSGAVLALGVAAWGFWALRSVDLFGLWPIRAHLHDVPVKKAPFVARGPYRWVRHPLYACALVVIWSCPDVTADRLLFDVLWSVWICLGTIWEEKDLSADFGDAYRDYQRRVPMLLPWRGRLEAPGNATIG